MKLLYIIGEPGAGKTTVVKSLTRRLPNSKRTVPYIAWTHYSKLLCQLGYDRGTFGGTDALGMACQKYVLAWLLDDPYKYVLAEGDRLANRKFFDALIEMGVELQIVLIQVPPEELERRREERNRKIGKAQDERWLKTRATKVANLAPDADLVLDGTRSTRELAQELGRTPVGRQFVRLRAKS